MTSKATAPPAKGFVRMSRSSPFASLIGPIYQRTDAGGLVIAVLAEEKHCNVRGHVHGGVLATLADIAMGYAAAFSTEPPTAMVTISLSIDFVGRAEQGAWIEIHTDVQKVGRQLAFANCQLHVEGRRIGRASAVFSVPGKDPGAVTAKRPAATRKPLHSGTGPD